MPLRVTVDGDTAHGWIADVHDGDKFGTYNPTGANALEAAIGAITQHGLKTGTATLVAQGDPAQPQHAAAPAAPVIDAAAAAAEAARKQRLADDQAELQAAQARIAADATLAAATAPAPTPAPAAPTPNAA
jgi:hypothetical protein